MKQLFILLSLLYCSFIVSAQDLVDSTAVATDTVSTLESLPQGDVQQEQAPTQAIDTATIENDSNYVFVVVEEMPQFPGGVDSMNIFLAKNMNMALFQKIKNAGQKAIIEFVVEPTGAISDPAVLRTSGIKAFDDEALRVVGLMPAWSPGLMSGGAVRTKIIIPIRLNGSK